MRLARTGDSGLTRSRKGTDASEMFDIRSYVPGDDIRSIHWKLSGKTDELIVRQASDRTHYDLVIRPISEESRAAATSRPES